jgi:hypothetical protein
MPAPTILEAIDHPQIWAPWFRVRTSWEPWRVFLAALFGLPLPRGRQDPLPRVHEPLRASCGRF